jgi:hypothetical protein
MHEMKILDEFSGSPVNLKRQGTDLEAKETNLCKKQKSQCTRWVMKIWILMMNTRDCLTNPAYKNEAHNMELSGITIPQPLISN